MNGIGYIFCRESAYVTFDIIFIVCILMDNSYEPISTWEI